VSIAGGGPDHGRQEEEDYHSQVHYPHLILCTEGKTSQEAVCKSWKQEEEEPDHSQQEEQATTQEEATAQEEVTTQEEGAKAAAATAPD
jgi:hypothetical protein